MALIPWNKLVGTTWESLQCDGKEEIQSHDLYYSVRKKLLENVYIKNKHLDSYNVTCKHVLYAFREY